MKYREQIKTMDEYAIELEKVAPQEIMRKFNQYLKEGQRVKAIQILRQCKVLDT